MGHPLLEYNAELMAKFLSGLQKGHFLHVLLNIFFFLSSPQVPERKRKRRSKPVRGHGQVQEGHHRVRAVARLRVPERGIPGKFSYSFWSLRSLDVPLQGGPSVRGQPFVEIEINYAL